MHKYMGKFFKLIIEDKITKWGILLSFLFIFLGLLITVIFFTQLPPFLPIYNKLPWGYARVGTKIEIFLPFLICIAITGTNSVISAKIYEKIPLLSRILCASALGASILYLIFIIQLIYLIK